MLLQLLSSSPEFLQISTTTLSAVCSEWQYWNALFLRFGPCVLIPWADPQELENGSMRALTIDHST
ncbi:hypothetical protein NC651_025863 [Populus alba x Populus x berolinensis]|nr:hypothetical protein NC651_025863 [Populus alba x Populus x berolinensis]